MNNLKTGILTCLILALCAVNALGFGSSNGRPQGKHDGPPPEAYTACKDKNKGEKASFTSPRGDTIQGICVKDRQGDRLVLRPDNPPQK
ncbi:hypothetical protein [Desulfoplanes formicivorans]|uniref:Uncharacterized protein n=1 Tax=Desulfoplanes formicivorans TaxID=1592317 RepID=A0A194AKW4_9BACT|nr:hypothetical protein [Desulfoplanes formicivorans]GAU09885.1 hypothetical protein DPF_2621 [Desulfoplanes formicivorans]